MVQDCELDGNLFQNWTCDTSQNGVFVSEGPNLTSPPTLQIPADFPSQYLQFSPPPQPPSPTLPPAVASTVTVTSPNNVEDSNANVIINNGSTTNASCTNQLACGQPVNLATGAMWHELTDFTLAGRTAATKIQFARMYLAQPLSAPGEFGPNWTHSWDAHLISASASTTCERK